MYTISKCNQWAVEVGNRYLANWNQGMSRDTVPSPESLLFQKTLFKQPPSCSNHSWSIEPVQNINIIPCSSLCRAKEEDILQCRLRPMTKHHLTASMGTSTQIMDSLNIWEISLVLMCRESSQITKFKCDSKNLFCKKKIWDLLKEKLIRE